MKFVCGGFAHETNTFSSKPTEVADFQLPGCWAEGHDDVYAESVGNATEIGGYIEECERQGISLVLTLNTNAAPMGKVADEMVDIFLEHLFRGLVSTHCNGLPTTLPPRCRLTETVAADRTPTRTRTASCWRCTARW